MLPSAAVTRDAERPEHLAQLTALPGDAWVGVSRRGAHGQEGQRDEQEPARHAERRASGDAERHTVVSCTLRAAPRGTVVDRVVTRHLPGGVTTMPPSTSP